MDARHPATFAVIRGDGAERGGEILFRQGQRRRQQCGDAFLKFAAADPVDSFDRGVAEVGVVAPVAVNVDESGYGGQPGGVDHLVGGGQCRAGGQDGADPVVFHKN